MRVYQRTQLCCGLAEIHAIQDYQPTEANMRAILRAIIVKRNAGGWLDRKGAYVFTEVAADYEGRGSDIKTTPRVDMLARLITEHKLGTATLIPFQNGNTSNHLNMLVWTIKNSDLRKWDERLSKDILDPDGMCVRYAYEPEIERRDEVQGLACASVSPYMDSMLPVTVATPTEVAA